MNKRTKVILIGSSLIITGIALYFVLSRGKQEDMGQLPSGDESNANQQSDEAAQNEAINTEGSNPIVEGDIIYPFGEYANLRTSMEVNNGLFNNMFVWGDMTGKVYSPSAIGKVCEVNNVAGHTWYKVDIGPLLTNDDLCGAFGCSWYNEYILTPQTINMWEAQDTHTPCNLTAYVRADVVTK